MAVSRCARAGFGAGVGGAAAAARRPGRARVSAAFGEGGGRPAGARGGGRGGGLESRDRGPGPRRAGPGRPVRGAESEGARAGAGRRAPVVPSPPPSPFGSAACARGSVAAAAASGQEGQTLASDALGCGSALGPRSAAPCRWKKSPVALPALPTSPPLRRSRCHRAVQFRSASCAAARCSALQRAQPRSLCPRGGRRVLRLDAVGWGQRAHPNMVRAAWRLGTGPARAAWRLGGQPAPLWRGGGGLARGNAASNVAQRVHGAERCLAAAKSSAGTRADPERIPSVAYRAETTAGKFCSFEHNPRGRIGTEEQHVRVL